MTIFFQTRTNKRHLKTYIFTNRNNSQATSCKRWNLRNYGNESSWISWSRDCPLNTSKLFNGVKTFYFG